MRSARLWAAAVVVWVGVIFFSSTSLASKWAESTFSFMSGALFADLRNDTGSYHLVHLLADKGFHVSLFCVLAMLLWLALGDTPHKGWIILTAGAFIGSCSEFLQRFFPDRDPAIRDVIINTAGTALGILICLLLTRIVRPSPRQRTA